MARGLSRIFPMWGLGFGERIEGEFEISRGESYTLIGGLLARELGLLERQITMGDRVRTLTIGKGSYQCYAFDQVDVVIGKETVSLPNAYVPFVLRSGTAWPYIFNTAIDHNIVGLDILLCAGRLLVSESRLALQPYDKPLTLH
jgi:hypothetical protein